MYQVIKRFNDRVTGERHEVGDTYAGNRSAELIHKGFVSWSNRDPDTGRFVSDETEDSEDADE